MILELGWSKRDVLEQIYIREVPIIIYKIMEKKKEKAIDAVIDKQIWMNMLVATSGMSPSKEGVEKIFEVLNKQLKSLEGDRADLIDDEREYDPEKFEKEVEKLVSLQDYIAQKKKQV